MDMRTAFVIGIAVLLFTMYYLEREMEKKQIFWLYAGLGVALGIISVRTVATNGQNFDFYLTFTVLSILIAILYFDEGEEAVPPKKEKEEKKKKKKPKKKKSKGR
jgi:predicted tellurium resistance membrane protein TerC